MSSEASYHLVAPVRPGSVDLVHELLEQLWSHEPVPSMVDRIRFETALIEVLGNIVEHAGCVDPPDAEPARRFELTVTSHDDSIEADLGDDGRPVEIDLADVTMPDLEAESGRGLALALGTVDEISYERVGPRNCWRLVCHRS